MNGEACRCEQIAESADTLSLWERRLLNEFQRGFPLTPRPYADIGARLGVSEREVLEALARLGEAGVVSRVGAVFRPNRVGSSTLAAMSVPAPRLLEVAEIVNSYAEVNHNYEREHRLNLWFVLTASSKARLKEVLADIERCTGLAVMSLPMLADYHIDLGFDLAWT